MFKKNNWRKMVLFKNLIFFRKCKEGINDKEVGVPDAFSLASCALIVLTRIQQINLDLDENAAKGIIGV
jgi:hypothetical protein